MSHTLKGTVLFKDPGIVEQTARELGLATTRGEIKLFDGKTVNGIGVKLPGWRYHVAIDGKTGEAFYDNYKGAWGHQSELDKFTQAYAVNKTTAAARLKGWIVSKQVQSNGTVALQITGM